MSARKIAPLPAQPAPLQLPALTTHAVLATLFERCAEGLDTQTLQWLAGAAEEAERQALDAAALVAGLADQVQADAERTDGLHSGALSAATSVPTLLLHLESTLQTVAGLVSLGNRARSQVSLLAQSPVSRELPQAP